MTAPVTSVKLVAPGARSWIVLGAPVHASVVYLFADQYRPAKAISRAAGMFKVATVSIALPWLSVSARIGLPLFCADPPIAFIAVRHDSVARSHPSRGAPISATEEASVAWYRTLSPAYARRSETDDVMTAVLSSVTSTRTASDVARLAVAFSTSDATSSGARAVVKVHVAECLSSAKSHDQSWPATEAAATGSSVTAPGTVTVAVTPV